MDDTVHQYDDSTSLPLRTAIFHDNQGSVKLRCLVRLQNVYSQK